MIDLSLLFGEVLSAAVPRARCQEIAKGGFEAHMRGAGLNSCTPPSNLVRVGGVSNSSRSCFDRGFINWQIRPNLDEPAFAIQAIRAKALPT